MNLTYLEDFVTLADVGNYHDAADQLFISQSSLSKHIQTLEKSLDVKLFERDTHQVKITEYGAAILPHARRILEIQMHIEQDIEALKHPDRKKEIIVGCSPIIPLYKFTNLATDFLKTHSYDIRILNQKISKLKQFALTSRCDLIITYNNRLNEDTDFMVLPYAEDVLAAVVSAYSPLAEKESITFEEASREPFISIGEDDFRTSFQLPSEVADQFIPDVAFHVDTVSQMLDLVTRGMGVSIMGRHSVRHFNVTGVSVVPISPQVPLCIDMLIPKSRKLSKEANLFIDFYTKSLDVKSLNEKKEPSQS